MNTPIDLADLERRGVLAQATGGWYLLLQPAALLVHVRKQAHALAQTRPTTMNSSNAARKPVVGTGIGQAVSPAATLRYG
jgi:hypothetical protein